MIPTEPLPDKPRIAGGFDFQAKQPDKSRFCSKRRRTSTSGTHVQLDNVALAPEFVELLLDWTQLMHVRLDVMRSLTSDLAQAIYLFKCHAPA